MEVVPVKDEEINKEESHITSAAAFVEGGIQEACDDACSICLEAFCDSDPSTVTSCKHEFHFQCVLEWCQRSSNCPMCWRPISLKDPASQELLEAVEQERNYRLTPSRNTTIFHHPSLGGFELQHLQMGVNDQELEDRIIQHLAAASAMGRTHRVSRREGSRSHSAAHGHPQFVVFSANPNASDPVSETDHATTVTNSSTEVLQQIPSSVRSNQISSSSSGTSHDNNRRLVGQSSLPNLDTAGPSSEFQSFSDSWKSRLNSISTKYKESISKSTRGWKEKLFSRSSSMADIGTEVKREVNAGIATVSRMMERLETRDNNRNTHASQENEVDSSVTERSNHENRDSSNDSPSNGNNSASFASNSVSS